MNLYILLYWSHIYRTSYKLISYLIFSIHSINRHYKVILAIHIHWFIFLLLNHPLLRAVHQYRHQHSHKCHRYHWRKYVINYIYAIYFINFSLFSCQTSVVTKLKLWTYRVHILSWYNIVLYIIDFKYQSKLSYNLLVRYWCSLL